VGNLMTLGKATPDLIASTRRWVERNLTREAIHATDWLFMSYHAYDYFFADEDFPKVESYQEAVIANILRLAVSAPENQRHTFFNFAPTPHSPVALAADEDLLETWLQTIESTQQEDGGWRDQHGLPQWYPWVTICNLLTLRAYDRLDS
jgi:hypothetical protein